MGGREVGGLANMLAAHMGFSEEERDRVRRFWDAPNLVAGPGLKAVDMFDAVADGRIRALWVMGTNPAVSLPRADAVREALRQARSPRRVGERRLQRHGRSGPRQAARRRLGREGRHRHQLRAAHLAPARRSCRSPARRGPTGGSSRRWRGGWATREAFAYASPAEIFDEHARLSGFENDGERAFDISGAAGLDRQAYDALEPFQWPCRRAEEPTARLFADGGFFTPDRKARFVAIAPPRLAAAGLGRLAVPAQHRPHPRPVAHHDAHGALAAPLHPHRRAVRGDPSRRRGPPGAGAGHAGQGRHAARHRHPARPRQPRPAAGHAVRADPLVGREQLRRPHRRAGAAGHRSRTPASRRPRPRPRASRRCPWRTTASPCRAGRCGCRASSTGRRRGRRSGMC